MSRFEPMIKTLSLTGKCIILLTILIYFSSFSSQAQTVAPKIKFRQPQLVSGVDKKQMLPINLQMLYLA